MIKPVIFYFVHAHGNGHKATFNLLYPALFVYFEIIAITTNNDITVYLQKMYRLQVVELPAKYPIGYDIPAHTFSKAFEVTPYAVEPAARAKKLAEAIQHYKPKALYCDGVPELAIMTRGMGVPVVLVHLHGDILNDPTQIFAHQLADHIVAHFPAAIEQDNYHFKDKTFYSGYVSKYAGFAGNDEPSPNADNITILLGYDNFDESVLENIIQNTGIRFTVIGNKKDFIVGGNCELLGPVEDIRSAIKSEIVISAAGQNTIAELLSLNKRLILLPEARPYEEQAIHAKILAERGIALLAKDTFGVQQWHGIIEEAKALKRNKETYVDPSAPGIIAKKMKNWYA